jgi:transcriptional regulator with XRE-family HTH domain
MAQRKGRPPGVTPDGPKIKSLRVGLGLTTAQVAEKVGLHAQSVRHAEKGRPISDVFASRLARALGVGMRDISDYAGDDAESEPEPKVPAA